MANMSTYPLRLPRSIKAAAETLAEKLSVLSTATFFQERANRSKPDAIDKILNAREGDEILR